MKYPIEQEIIENIGGTIHNLMNYLHVTADDGEHDTLLPNRVRYHGIEDGAMHLSIDDIGDFTVRMIVTKPPDERNCTDCNDATHQCGGCGTSVEHGEMDCNGAGGPGCPTFHDLPMVRADALREGDEIYSDTSHHWHRVLDASNRAGRFGCSVTIDNGGKSFLFKVQPATEFRTRRAPESVAAELLGATPVGGPPWLVTGTPSNAPYPCRCAERRGPECSPLWCPDAGRTDLAILPRECCAHRFTPEIAAAAQADYQEKRKRS